MLHFPAFLIGPQKVNVAVFLTDALYTCIGITRGERMVDSIYRREVARFGFFKSAYHRARTVCRKRTADVKKALRFYDLADCVKLLHKDCAERCGIGKRCRYDFAIINLGKFRERVTRVIFPVLFAACPGQLVEISRSGFSHNGRYRVARMTTGMDDGGSWSRLLLRRAEYV